MRADSATEQPVTSEGYLNQYNVILNISEMN